MKTKNYLSIDWHSIFEYNEDSPSGLVWKINANSLARKGEPAGNLDFNKYGNPKAWRIRYLGVRYLVHRVIWVMHYGTIDDELFIDHINRNPKDNRISNLRLLTGKENHQNKKMTSRNKSGKTGVCFRYVGGVLQCMAFWTENGKERSRSFSTARYGLIPAWHNACVCRDENMKRLNLEENCSYTDDHGT